MPVGPSRRWYSFRQPLCLLYASSLERVSTVDGPVLEIVELDDFEIENLHALQNAYVKSEVVHQWIPIRGEGGPALLFFRRALRLGPVSMHPWICAGGGITAGEKLPRLFFGASGAKHGDYGFTPTALTSLATTALPQQYFPRQHSHGRLKPVSRPVVSLLQFFH